MRPASKDEAIKQAYDSARHCELNVRGCAQSVVLSLQDALDMRDDGVFRAASGLSGGIGGMHDVCGALLGAFLVFGMKYGRGRDELENTQKMMDSFLPVARLYKWFEKEYGGVTCRQVRIRTLGVYYDTKIPWQAELAAQAGLYEICADLCGKVARRVVEMLWEDR